MRQTAIAVGGLLLLCATAASAASLERFDDAPTRVDIQAFLVGAPALPGPRLPPGVAVPVAPPPKPVRASPLRTPAVWYWSPTVQRGISPVWSKVR